jgi:hypothetical protein
MKIPALEVETFLAMRYDKGSGGRSASSLKNYGDVLFLMVSTSMVEQVLEGLA